MQKLYLDSILDPLKCNLVFLITIVDTLFCFTNCPTFDD